MIRLRNLIVICLLIALGTACTQEEPPVHTILLGKIPVGTEEAQIHTGNEWEDLSLAEDGTFIDTISITDPQYVYISIGDLSTRAYFTPGDEVTIAADSVFTFTGSNSDINAYLYQLYQDDAARGNQEFNNHQKVFSQKEAEYVRYRDSIKMFKLNQLAQLPAGNEVFQAFHQKDIEYDFHYNVARYPNYHSYYFNDYKPTEIITAFHKNVSLDNEPYARHYTSYRALVDFLLDKQVEHYPDTSLSPLEVDLAVIKDIQSPTILHVRLNKALYDLTVNVKNMKEMRDKMLALAKLDKTKRVITEHYEIISKLSPGSPSPTFDFENFTGGTTKLADLKGKYVYIDVWATWCTPCIREIPHLKQIEKEFHNANIEFVSISVDEDWAYNTWKAMIKNKELGGTQLLADNSFNSDFVKDYGIQGIPHFILLDEQGNIVSAKADSPSNPQLKEQLQGLGL